ncbi:hypothetical protein BKH41_03625 [Helicobacter sp. 12S02232-10]|uniref:tyrosine-type recombinase/integrase n=1 Tax=Helicobacter sp. 12S02232-10 TaxID=1476197 RepID=UPI000BA5608B|nr:site-specific integrase [Helicobacter sp. 12S02232-10]PAF49183.1 hypothetical protein BKH41_03625 [Helicobacter sp. 12S02232-10]
METTKYEGVKINRLKNGDIAYYVRFSKDGKQHQQRVGSKFQGWNEKKAFNKKIELEHSYVDRKPVKFSEAVARFLEVQKSHLRKKTLSTYKGAVKSIDFLMDKKVENIAQKEINDLKIELREKLSPATISRAIMLVKQIIKFAESEYGIKNPHIDNFKNLNIDNKRERFLKKDEILLLKKALKNEYECLLFVNLALCTGARLMTLLEIRKKDIDLKTKTIALNDFKNSSKYQGYLNSETIELILKKWDNLQDDDKVIQRSKRLLTERLREVFNQLFNQNNPSTKQKVVIHTLRHTFASHLAIQGTPIQIIQKLLNHKDIQMTMRYSHLMPDSGKEWVDRLWDKN